MQHTPFYPVEFDADAEVADVDVADVEGGDDDDDDAEPELPLLNNFAEVVIEIEVHYIQQAFQRGNVGHYNQLTFQRA